MITFRRLKIRDFRVIERADVDMAGRGLVLVRGDNQDTDAASSNGSGKTTLYSALSWCLYDRLIPDGKTIEVIRRGSDSTRVRVELDDDGTLYEIERRRDGNGAKLLISQNKIPINPKNLAEGQARVDEILGLDWDAFRNTVLFGQNDVSRFADPAIGDADRKAILKKILRLDRLDVATARARTSIKEVEGSMADRRGRLSVLEALRVNLERQHEEAGRQTVAWHKTRDDSVMGLRRQIEQARAGVVVDRKAASTLPRMLDIRKGVVERVVELEEATDRDVPEVRQEARYALHAAEQAFTQRVRDVSVAERAVVVAEAVHSRAVDAVRSAGQGRCPTCDQTYEGETKARLIEEAVKAKNRTADELRKAIAAKVEAEVARDEANEVVEAARGGVGKAEVRFAKAKEADEALKGWRSKLSLLDGRISDAKEAKGRVDTVDARIEGYEERIATLLASENPHLGRAGSLTEQIAVNLVEASTVQAAIVEHERRLEMFRFWEAAFGNRGLVSLILDAVVPMIASSANGYLRTLADGDIRIELDTERDLKSGSRKDEITFRRIIEGHKDVQPSGGQTRKIALAVDLALTDLVAAREGARIDLLLLDEVLDGLDAEGRTRVVRLLHELRERRSTILVIAHDPEIAEHFETELWIRKSGGKAIVA